MAAEEEGEKGRGAEQEKRFHSIMEKLFSSHSSSPTTTTTTTTSSSSASSKSLALPSTTSSSLSRGTKRPNTDLSSPHPLHPSDPPLCRPWDRGDLMRRVSTFKSMTWFAKPKVVSAVNCARRGWINVDMDVLACEACGARLLFSTPSSWTQQQVEKAALVFSLKLDSGHKLLCPWIDNACDERLAEFPPTTPPLLVDNFRERCFALLQLVALPVISSSAMKYMKSPQLDEFLKQSPGLEFGNGSTSVSQIQATGDENVADSSRLYYQAQKLISLCGWELRSLPYVVDRKDRAKQLGNDSVFLNSSKAVSNKQSQDISTQSSFINENVDADKDYGSHSEPLTDPNSVVLDCRLCGATVGLWTFSTIPRPLEYVRLVGYTQPNSDRNSGQATGHENNVDGRGGVITTANGALAFIRRSSNLNLTIAGGPPPTKQKFKATISFPVIGRNLRARLSYDSEFIDHICSNQEDIELRSGDKDLHLEERDPREGGVIEQVPQPESAGLLESKTQDPGQCSSLGGGQSSCLNQEVIVEGAALTEQKNTDMDVTDAPGEKNSSPIDANDFLLEFPFESNLDTENINDQLNKLFDTSSIGDVHSSQVGTSNVSEQGGNVLGTNEKNTRNDSLDAQEKGQEGMKGAVDTEVVVYGTGDDLGLASSDKLMEFDPIRQHRHFCPWIMSASSRSPGWQQTLSALLCQKDHSYSPATSSRSPSIIKVDDPITSVRKLFKFPSARKKAVH